MRELFVLRLDRSREVSPFVWRSVMALAHKGLDYDKVPIGYGDKHLIAFSGQDRVPVLRDGDVVVSDSWRIACHLEDTYPDAPSLFGDEVGRGMARFINHWCDTQVLGSLFLMLAAPTHDVTPAADQPYFRDSRAQWTGGMTMDDFRARAPKARERLTQILQPVAALLEEQPFLCGDAPAYADYCLFGGFMWARTTSGEILSQDAHIECWRQRLLDLFDGLARTAPNGEDG